MASLDDNEGVLVSEVIERAISLATKPDIDIDALEASLERARNFKPPTENNIFGVERASFNKIKNTHRTIQGEIDYINKMKVLSEKYLALSFEPLTWRDDKGFPLLIPFSINYSTVCLGYKESGRKVWLCKKGAELSYWGNPTSLNKKLEEQYQDMTKVLRGPRGGQNYLQYEFSGFIPNPVRKQIKEAVDIGLKIFIITEPMGHKIRQVERINPDPLVVGLDNKDRMYLIADFDTTPIEEMMVFNG